MAKIVLTDAYINIGGTTLSQFANSVTLTYEKEAIEVTAFGSTGRTFQAGLQNISCEVAFMQDFAATEVEATVYPIVGTTTTVVIKPTSGAKSSTNPEYTITGAYLATHTPVAGTVGEVATTTLTFQGGSLAKATS
jgi:hypothetical protein